ncbi:MAG: tyrosine-type recombinase/integrase [Xenococcaceae cyanobacterium]
MARVSDATKKPDEINPGSRSLSQFVSQSQQKKKAAKGTVVVQIFKERLRLVWSYAGKRYFLYLGLPDSKTNRIVADQKARQIEGDMATGNFDPTLKKYKFEAVSRRSQISAVALFEQFTESKAKYLATPTLAKYAAIVGYFKQCFGDNPASAIAEIDAEAFTDWLLTQIEPITAKDRLALIKACWQWGIEQDLIESNPWKEMSKRIKPAPKQPPKPFSREEMGAIVHALGSDRYYHHYADYVEFLFGTGCRTGEAIGLKWKHVSNDCSTVWIGESLSRKVRKSTKTNRARTIALTPKLQAILLAKRPAEFDPEGLVFTAPKGGAIDDNNFRNRAWKTVLTRLEIDYRKPYTTRHTLVSHALDLGMNPVVVAQLTGHDVQVLFKNYAGNVNSRPRLPEL